VKPKPSLDPFDYENYSLEELYDARLHIEASKHPDRVRTLDEQIAARERLLEERPELAEKPRAPLWPLAVLGGLIVVIVGLVLAVTIPKTLASQRRIERVVVALETAYPDASPVEAKIVGSGGGGSGPQTKGKSKGDSKEGAAPAPVSILLVKVVQPGRLDDSYEDKKAHANDVATAAFAAYDESDSLTTVGVHLLKETGAEAAPGDRFVFPAATFRDPEKAPADG